MTSPVDHILINVQTEPGSSQCLTVVECAHCSDTVRLAHHSSISVQGTIDFFINQHKDCEMEEPTPAQLPVKAGQVWEWMGVTMAVLQVREKAGYALVACARQGTTWEKKQPLPFGSDAKLIINHDDPRFDVDVVMEKAEEANEAEAFAKEYHQCIQAAFSGSTEYICWNWEDMPNTFRQGYIQAATEFLRRRKGESK
jgi:hypothetical protein